MNQERIRKCETTINATRRRLEAQLGDEKWVFAGG